MKEKEIRSRLLQFTSLLKANSPLSGEWESIFRGSGFELADIREFQPGDEVKKIHWPSVVKTGQLYIIERKPLRQLEILILLDVSSSMLIPPKFSIAINAAGILAVSALHFSNLIGLNAFSDKIEKQIPPALEDNQFTKIFEFLLEKEENPVWGRKTDFLNPLRAVSETSFSRKLVFLVSDFLIPDLGVVKDFFRNSQGYCDCTPIVIRAPNEYKNLKGFRVNLMDAETGQTKESYLSSASLQKIIEREERRLKDLSDIFRSFSLSFAVLENPDLQDCFRRLSTCFAKKVKRA